MGVSHLHGGALVAEAGVEEGADGLHQYIGDVTGPRAARRLGAPRGIRGFDAGGRG